MQRTPVAARTTAPLYPGHAVVVCADAAREAEARALAARLDLPFARELPAEPDRLAFVLTPERLQVQVTGLDAPGAVYADFVQGATARRARAAVHADEGLLRAIGARKGATPEVIDATAGLGRDACLLAAVGCRVIMVERHAAVAALLTDAVERARRDPEAAELAGRMELVEADAVAVLAERRADAVLLDPMHPPRRKSAKVRKEMRLFRELVGADPDSDALLAPALEAARRRVVVKRPRGAAALAGPAPSGSIDGRSTRFDIYAGRAGDA